MPQLADWPALALSSVSIGIAAVFFGATLIEAVSMWRRQPATNEGAHDDDMATRSPTLVVRSQGPSGGDAHIRAVARGVVVSVRVSESGMGSHGDQVTARQRMATHRQRT
jgi:hypothetical protein